MAYIKHIKLAIKPNKCTGHELCAICGESTEPQQPFDLFLDASSQLVCKNCAIKYAPELVSLMDYFYKGHYVVPEYDTIENEINAIKNIAENLQLDDLFQLEQDLLKVSKQAYLLRKFVANNLMQPCSD